MWILLVFLSEYISASTEPIFTIPNDGPESKMILSENIMKIIMQYLNIRDYFRLTQTNRAYYQTLYVHKPEDILQVLHDQYFAFLTTRMMTDKAEISLWGKYSDILQSLPANTQYQLHAVQSLMFFTPGDMQSPKIQCSSMKTDIKGTTKKIQNFFQDHPNTFVNNPKALQPQFYINDNHQKAQTTALAMFYNPLQSTLYFWTENDHTFECRVELPRVMVFTHPEHNRIRIDRLSKLTGQFLMYEIADQKVFIISWFNIAEGEFIEMTFTKTGSLNHIQTYKSKENDMIYDVVDFRRIKGEQSKFISKRKYTEFTTITAFSYLSGPYNHHPAKRPRVDDYKAFLDTMTNLPSKHKKK